MGRDSGSLIGGKRSRPADDEAYFDNFHNHKRYLTEVRDSRCFYFVSSPVTVMCFCSEDGEYRSTWFGLGCKSLV
jgi:hypothetical protein